MINFPKKLSCKYIYLKVVNFIYNIFINYDLLKYQSILFLKKKKNQNINVYIYVYTFTYMYDMLFRLKTNILIPKFDPKQKIRAIHNNTKLTTCHVLSTCQVLELYTIIQNYMQYAHCRFSFLTVVSFFLFFFVAS